MLGVEVSETSADWARSNARSNGISHVEFLAADAGAIFAQVDFPAEKTAVVIDPPRKGCSMEFLTQLFAFSPGKVVYVSCNPATQIRDLAEFDKAYERFGFAEDMPLKIRYGGYAPIRVPIFRGDCCHKKGW